MKRTTKVWLGVGVCIMAGSGALPPSDPHAAARTLLSSSALTDPGATASAAQHVLRIAHHHRKTVKAKPAREGGEGEAGARSGESALAPDLDFALKIAQIRGHLLVGDELVQEGQWNGAYPHFRHPTEELYGPIRGRLKEYQTPPFEAALQVLANQVKRRKGGDDYAGALKAVTEALDAADQGVKAKQEDWNSFRIEVVLELLKSATEEYQGAIVNGRIAKPVEYQDARGFVWQADRMVESMAPALERKDADALKQVRAALAELKQTWPAAMPPKTPVKDYGAVLGDVSRIELAAGKLM